MNGWAIKDGEEHHFIESVCASEDGAWTKFCMAHKCTKADFMMRGYTCVPVVIQEAGCQHLRRDQDRCADCGKMLIVKPAQPDIERRMRDDVAALGPFEALRRIKEPKQAGSGEAVAYRFKVGGAWFTGSTWTACDKAIKDANVTAAIEPLYAHPPASADEGIRKKYDELLYAVSKKHEGETRHQIALRYITNAETCSGVAVEAAAKGRP